jgi:tRNA-2-methylthio-N6-dimethylallyladenosine synthase
LNAVRFSNQSKGSVGTGDVRRGRVFLLNSSKRCEPSAYLFTKAVTFFLANGYGMAESIEESEIILMNTCCVTEDKIAVSRANLEFAGAEGKGKTIVLFGCMADLPGSWLEPAGLIPIGPKSLNNLDRHFPHHTPVDQISVNRLPPAFYEPGQGLSHDDYFVMTAQGCINRCAYCNIKRVKGDVQSEPVETILRQIRTGLSLGVKEFVLLADDCASYGRDIGTDLTQLIERLFALSGNFNLKLGYLYPQFLIEHFERLEVLFSTGRIRYVNIPVQSGSQQILERMNRHYSIDRVMAALRWLRIAAPGTTFCTHIMINFPTESHEDFLRSLSVADGFDEVLFLHYSDNRGTAASELFPKVPRHEAHRRLDMASEYANHMKMGRSAVIKDFSCDIPYNMTRAEEKKL